MSLLATLQHAVFVVQTVCAQMMRGDGRTLSDDAKQIFDPTAHKLDEYRLFGMASLLKMQLDTAEPEVLAGLVALLAKLTEELPGVCPFVKELLMIDRMSIQLQCESNNTSGFGTLLQESEKFLLNRGYIKTPPEEAPKFSFGQM